MKSTRSYWICAVITFASAAMSAGFSIHALFALGTADPTAAYAASRSVALVIVALGLMRFRSRDALAALALTMGLVRAFDAAIGVLQHDVGKTVGPAVLALAAFASVRALLTDAAVRST